MVANSKDQVLTNSVLLINSKANIRISLDYYNSIYTTADAAIYLLSTSNRNELLPYIRERGGCYISSFYIKPQLWKGAYADMPRCYISSFYIKPQRQKTLHADKPCCYISSFYIKPQPYIDKLFYRFVAIYLLSTSNRN